ncbi:hypothetical protein SLA_2053 [Streptomyces laurentii]|uniref:Uncharacterized protein n=1 Tax=Streptomyces laurentii TaxID=39478 RepID=A0A160NYN5_STRLU|nr:hypothetical protein SLA_2053 [Streptomyces laurentii]
MNPPEAPDPFDGRGRDPVARPGHAVRLRCSTRGLYNRPGRPGRPGAAPARRASAGRAHERESTKKAPSTEGDFLSAQVKRVNLRRVAVGRVGLEPISVTRLTCDDAEGPDISIRFHPADSPSIRLCREPLGVRHTASSAPRAPTAPAKPRKTLSASIAESLHGLLWVTTSRPPVRLLITVTLRSVVPLSIAPSGPSTYS